MIIFILIRLYWYLRDVKYYITKDNDTLLSVNRLLGGNINKFLSQNNNIYLEEGQLIVYKD